MSKSNEQDFLDWFFDKENEGKYPSREVAAKRIKGFLVEVYLNELQSILIEAAALEYKAFIDELQKRINKLKKEL